MPTSPVKILLIEDNLAEARLLQEILKGFELRAFQLAHVKRLAEGLKQLAAEHFDVILLDLTLPDSQGLTSLPTLMQQAPSLPIVVLTNTNDEDLALEAVRRGAQDYLVKRKVNVEVLVRSVRYAIERKRAAEALREENEVLEAKIRERTAELLKAKELNQLKSEFVSMLSHDFRNPLTTILASAGLLQDSDRDLSPEKKIALFQRIRSASRDLARLLDEVLLVGRADSGKLHCQPLPLALEPFCRQLIEDLPIEGCENPSVIDFVVVGNVEESLWDESLLHHILVNLLGNAVKYSPADSQVRFELMAQSHQVIFRIQDWGIGIPKNGLEQLFQPFYRASNVGNISGNGLGLAIVRRCVETHGGQISVESAVGVGTTFTVTLPVLKGGESF